jgi:hypothetical protein
VTPTLSLRTGWYFTRGVSLFPNPSEQMFCTHSITLLSQDILAACIPSKMYSVIIPGLCLQLHESL